jgi:hypothetical protein
MNDSKAERNVLERQREFNDVMAYHGFVMVHSYRQQEKCTATRGVHF